jgi:hypothetical protein
MKKRMLAVMLAVVVCLVAFPGAFAQTVAAAPTSSVLAMALPPLPPEIDVPAALPAGMEDAVLLEAWVRLYNRQETILLWGGRSVTGRELAQFLLHQAIPVVWDRTDVCRGSSCSAKYRTDAGWIYEDGAPGVEPIYVQLLFLTDMAGLTATLAHEAFHRTSPFGDVRDSRFEEYWAYFVGTQIAPAAGLQFGLYDPFEPGQLNLWFRVHRIEGYGRLPDYPPSILIQVYGGPQAVSTFAGAPSATLVAQR